MRRNIRSGIPTRSAIHNLELVLDTLLCLINSISANTFTIAHRNTRCLRRERWDLRMNDSNGLPGTMYWTQRERWYKHLTSSRSRMGPEYSTDTAAF